MKKLIYFLMIIPLMCACTKEKGVTLPDNIVLDADKNSYHIITIGTQKWLKENLKTTTYNDHEMIPTVVATPTEKSNQQWADLRSPGYCWFNSIPDLNTDYGALYNWYAVNTDKLCPVGWHVPSDSEWKTLEMYIGMSKAEADTVAWRGGGLAQVLKTNYDWTGLQGTDDYGFSALPTGYRGTNGMFDGFNTGTGFWCSTNFDHDNAWARSLVFYHEDIFRGICSKINGLSVRCIKDNQ